MPCEILFAGALEAPPGPFNSGDLVTRALSQEEILGVITSFGEATRRAIEADFDGIELHSAHGFLIQNFLPPCSISVRTTGAVPRKSGGALPRGCR